MQKINIEINDKYREHIDLLKQIIPDQSWQRITDDSKIMEVLIETFIWFIQEQAQEHEHKHDKNWNCCWGH